MSLLDIRITCGLISDSVRYPRIVAEIQCLAIHRCSGGISGWEAAEAKMLIIPCYIFQKMAIVCMSLLYFIVIVQQYPIVSIRSKSYNNIKIVS